MEPTRRAEQRAHRPLVESDQEDGECAHGACRGAVRVEPGPRRQELLRGSCRQQSSITPRDSLAAQRRGHPGQRCARSRPDRAQADHADAGEMTHARSGATDCARQHRRSCAPRRQARDAASPCRSQLQSHQRIRCQIAAHVRIRPRSPAYDAGVAARAESDLPSRALAGQGAPTLRDQLAATLGAPTRQDPTAMLGGHARAKPVRALSPHFTWLIGALHAMTFASASAGAKKGGKAKPLSAKVSIFSLRERLQRTRL